MTQALILAGGRGERLRPITDYVPKPLVPLANISLLEWQLRYLQQFDIYDVVICTGYKAELIQNFLSRGGYDQVRISMENEPLGTGGAIRNAATYIHDDFYVLNGDIITDININSIKPNHIASVPMRTQFGTLKIKENNIIEFKEKQVIRDQWINAGVYGFKTDVFAELPIRGDIEKTLFPRWAHAGRLKVIKFPDSRWYSIDSFKDLQECSRYVSDIIPIKNPYSSHS